LKQSKWSFDQRSTDDPASKPFWIMELNIEPFFTRKLFNLIKKKIGNNYELERVYANGQTFGLDGFPHMDTPNDDGYTFLVYMNREWDLLWGGDTVFINRYFDINTNTEKYFDGESSLRTKRITPTPNKALFFPGNLIHYAESPTRAFYGLRMSLAYKLVKI
jgi:hypothetical protein